MKPSVPASQIESQAATTSLAAQVQTLIAGIADVDIYDGRLRQLLEGLHVPLACDAALVMFRVDEYSARSTVYGTAPNALLDSLTSPAVFAEAVDRRCSQYIHDYRKHSSAVPALRIWGTVSAVILPILAKPDFEGAVLLLWRRPQTFPDPLQTAITAVWSYLSTLR